MWRKCNHAVSYIEENWIVCLKKDEETADFCWEDGTG